ncbi:hypothetical protein GCM10010520_41350 [Rhizobium viscosum]
MRLKSLDISLYSSLCLSLSAYADCPVEMGCSSATYRTSTIIRRVDWKDHMPADAASEEREAA